MSIEPIKSLFLSLFILCSQQLFAQHLLSGKVLATIDESPLTGAYVYPESDPGRVAIVDSLGNYTIDMPGPDSILVSFLGFEPAKAYANLEEPQLDFWLEPSQSHSSATVTVKGRRIPHGEMASQRISQLQIYLNPAAKADPLLAVNSLPAATNLDETANVSFRGSPSEATGIYLNGVPIQSAVRLDQSNGVGQFSIFGQFPLEEVRVYAAHPPVSFSQATAGAVSLQTSKQHEENERFGLSLNLVGLGLSYARPIGAKTSIRSFANISNIALFKGLNGQQLLDLRGSSSLDGALQLLHEFKDDFSLQAFYLGFDENYQFRVRSTYYDGDLEQTKSRHIAILNWRLDREDWEWSIDQGIDWNRGQFRYGNITSNPTQFNVYASLQARHNASGFTDQLGLQWQHLGSQVNGQFPTNDYQLTPADAAVTYADSSQYQIAEVYLYRQWRMGAKWLLGAGLKPLYHFNQQTARWTIQGSLNFRPSSKHRISLGGGQFQQWLSPGPNFEQWQWLQIRQWALAYDFSGPVWSSSLAIYQKSEAYSVADDQKVRGVESRVDFKDGNIRSWISLTTVVSQSQEDNLPSQRDLPFLARAQFNWDSPSGWSAGLSGSWREGRYFLPLVDREPIAGTENLFRPIYAAPNDGQRYPNYLRLDLSLSKMLRLGNGQLIVYANVNNLLNKENVRSYFYEGGGPVREAENYSQRIFFVGGVYQWFKE